MAGQTPNLGGYVFVGLKSISETKEKNASLACGVDTSFCVFVLKKKVVLKS